MFIAATAILSSLAQQSRTVSRSYTVGSQSGAAAEIPEKRHTLNPFAVVRLNDANFSEPPFRAFACLLFTRLHSADSTNDLAGYFDASILRQRQDEQPATDVVVGATRYGDRSSVPSGWDGIGVEFEATYSVPSGEKYTVERWTFAKRESVLSKDPESLLTLGCPNCGSSGELSPAGQCQYCHTVVNNGQFNWKVISRQVVEIMPKPPIQLSLGGVEAGTEEPTLLPRNFDAERRAFQTRHPQFRWTDFAQRADQVFMRLQEAWSSLDFDLARPFETDTLYDTHRFWIERYRQQGLRNQLSQIIVESIEPCRFDHDAFYDIITARIFASMVDVTTDISGAIISGDPNVPRRFSEYWTFIRRIGVKDGPVTTNITACPNCGAGLAISQAGICEHCQSKITSGTFDWILSSIDQDESYTG